MMKKEAPMTQKTAPLAPAKRNMGIEQTATTPYCWARETSRPPRNTFRAACKKIREFKGG